MSIDWADHDRDANEKEPVIEVVEAQGFPPPRHEADADLFARHEGVPGHDQEKLANARIVMVGAGGLGSWVGLALVRSGIRHLTIIDPDRFERTNAPRQLMFGGDIGRPKAVALGRNLAPHMIAGGTITAVVMSLQHAIARYPIPADVLLVLVDNNTCRMQAVKFARQERIAAVFAMLSLDGMRAHAFLQGADARDACLWCALPNLAAEDTTPCAAAVVTTCMLVSAHTAFFAHRALLGWPQGMPPINWRASDLLGREPESAGLVVNRTGCNVCK